MFEKIYGNELQKKIISSMIEKDRLVHSIILTGDKGLGKFTFAKEIAKQVAYANNLNKNIQNCVDINIIDGNLCGSIVINNIRDIKSKINIAPHEGIKKIQIIANCEKMTVAAQNAILKSLEEPSQSTIFILTTSNICKLLSTIKSRAIVINMSELSEPEAIKILSSRASINQISKIALFVKIFGGNIGLVESLLNNISEDSDLIKNCENFLFSIAYGNRYKIMDILSQYQNSTSLSSFLEIFKIYFEKILKTHLTKKNLDDLLINHSSENFSFLEKYIYISDLINKTIKYIEFNVNFNLLVTWLNSNLIK